MKSKRKFKNTYFEKNDNKNINIQNLQDAAKAILRGEFIAIQALLLKQDRSQTTRPERTRKRRKSKTQSQQKEENVKDQIRNK